MQLREQSRGDRETGQLSLTAQRTMFVLTTLVTHTTNKLVTGNTTSVETNSNFWSNTNTNNYSDSILGRIRIRIIIRILKKYSNIFEYLKIFE